ncbi:MAG TPA: ABC transporter transmembrane domain-containing protein, partial [Aggregatilineaceae bacterium]|nr:ABC transporter transmembrane domain-containing protein [Aggregatilineaceae bacterium]
MGFHGMWAYIQNDNVKPHVSRTLLKRVFGFARPYQVHIGILLVTILISTGLDLLQPLILRDLIDRTLPGKDYGRLNWLALGLVLLPVVRGGVTVLQRRVNAMVGEGVIFDLRVRLYSHLQHMSIRFFTNTKTGELMSRLNNDVIGAQRAISNTVVDIVTSVIQAVAILIVMFSLDWRLTLMGLVLVPLFVPIARRAGKQLRTIAREAMGYNAQMNAMMNETLNIGGVLLVK